MAGLPVLNYHSVSSDSSWRHPLPARLSIHPDFFEWQLDFLQRKGYFTVSLTQAHALLVGAEPWPANGRPVALTFDDGYADNWTAVFPRLKVRRMKATFFVNTDFVDPDDTLTRKPDDAAPGYMTAAEIRAAADSGLVEIQSHGMRHERVFIDDRLTGVYTGTRADVPIQWLLHPDEKTRWWRHFPDATLIGHPVFENGTALNHPEYRPDPTAVSAFQSWFREQPAERLRGPGAAGRMRHVWASLSHAHARRETSKAYTERIDRELRGSRELLEEWTGRPVRFFCWPENEFSEFALARALDAGYLATVSNFHRRSHGRACVPDRIGRRWVGERVLGMPCPPADRWIFAHMLRSACGDVRSGSILKSVAALRKLCACLQGGPA